MHERSRSGIPSFFNAVRLGCIAAAGIFIQLGVSVNTREFGKAAGIACCEENQ